MKMQGLGSSAKPFFFAVCQRSVSGVSAALAAMGAGQTEVTASSAPAVA
jgi:hypothetical protein